MNVLEMKCFRGLVGVTRMDRVRNGIVGIVVAVVGAFRTDY